MYGRVWAPGGSRVAPRQQSETVQDRRAARTQRQLMAMLYGGPTGGAPPAPADRIHPRLRRSRPTGQAWVEIHAGIDINPAALTLPAVPLAS